MGGVEGGDGGDAHHGSTTQKTTVSLESPSLSGGEGGVGGGDTPCGSPARKPTDALESTSLIF